MAPALQQQLCSPQTDLLAISFTFQQFLTGTWGTWRYYKVSSCSFCTSQIRNVTSAAISQISSSEKALSLHFMPLISPRWDSEQVFFGFCPQLIGLWSVGCAEPPPISTKGRLIARAPFKGHTIKLCRCFGMDLTEWLLLSIPADVIFGLCRTEFPPSLCFSPQIHRTWEDPPEKGRKSTYVPAAPPWM